MRFFRWQGRYGRNNLGVRQERMICEAFSVRCMWRFTISSAVSDLNGKRRATFAVTLLQTQRKHDAFGTSWNTSLQKLINEAFVSHQHHCVALWWLIAYRSKRHPITPPRLAGYGNCPPTTSV